MFEWPVAQRADEFFYYSGVVHFFIRISNPHAEAKHQAGQTSRCNRSAVGVFQQKFAQGLAPRARKDQNLKTSVVRPRKFTAEQKVRAIENYLAHGALRCFHLQGTGLPGAGLLHAWVQEFNPRVKPSGVLGASSNVHKYAEVVALCTR